MKLSQAECTHASQSDTNENHFQKESPGGELAGARKGPSEQNITFPPTYGTPRRPQPLGQELSDTGRPEGAGRGRSAPGGSPGRWSPGHPW